MSGMRTKNQAAGLLLLACRASFRCGRKRCALLLPALLAVASCAAQAVPPARGQSAAEASVQASTQSSVQTDTQVVPQKAPQATITLGVVVTDGAGQPVAGLTAQDFTVLDEKTPTRILAFHAVVPARHGVPSEDEPAQVVFVLDQINMTFMDTWRAMAQLISFLRKGDETLRVPASVLLLSDTTASFSGSPTRDARALAAGLEKNTPALRSIRRSAAFYGDLERLSLSLRGLSDLATYEATRPGRKQVIWVSPGWPYLAGTRAGYTPKQRQGNFTSVVDLSSRLRLAGITLYSVDPRGVDDAGGFQTTYYKGFLKGVRTADATTLSNLGLQVLASQSGGLVLNSSNDVSREIANCFDDEQSYYVLSIAAEPAEKARYHELTVRLNRTELTARTRAGYYALPVSP